MRVDAGKTIRAVLLCLLAALLGLLQNTAFFTVSGVSFYPTIALFAAVCVFCGEYAAFGFGVLCGLLFDLSSAAPDGLYTLLFAVCGVGLSLLFSRYLRRSLSSAILFSLIPVAVFFVISSFISTGASIGFFKYFAVSALPSAALSWVWIFPFFFLAEFCIKNRKA